MVVDRYGNSLIYCVKLLILIGTGKPPTVATKELKWIVGDHRTADLQMNFDITTDILK